MVVSPRLMLLVALVALATATSEALRPPRPGVKDDPPKAQRLEITAIPETYDILIVPDLENKKFTGTVVITATVIEEDTNQVMFHADRTIAFTGGSVTWDGNKTQNLAFEDVNLDASLRNAKWPTGVANETEITLTIEYSGVISADMDGFYISTYTDQAGDAKILASTQFESVSARKAFPCLDEPHLKATFKMAITAPTNYSVLFNTPGTADADSNTFTFDETPKMSTYLVAFVIYDPATYTNLNSSEGKHRVWSRDHLSGQRQLALDAGDQCLKEYSTLFGINYDDMGIGKMDQIAIPDFSAGAMENWGLVTYRESALLGDPDETSISDQRDIIETVAHELAHQWFGDIVSPDYWNVLWLNEGFATYWMYHVAIDLYKTFNMASAFVAIDMETALQADAYDSSHAMTVPLAKDEAFDGMFDDIAYEKAGSVIRMMSYLVGSDQFLQGLKAYLQDRQYNTATPDDLYNFLSPNDTEFATNMLTWSDNAGYPVVKVTRDDKGSATLTQTRYLTSGSNGTGPAPWNTPITYINSFSAGESNEVLWLKGDDPLSIPNLTVSNPLVVNLQRQGFYRVNYDVENWLLIASLLQNNVTALDEVTRTALISDAFAMARSGHLDYSTALDLSTYLVNEVNYVPWEVAFQHLSFLDTCLAGSDAYDQFKKYLVTLVTKSYDAVGFEVDAKDDAQKRLHRENIVRWACKIGLPDCSDKVKMALDNSSVEVHPDVRGVVFCEAVRSNTTLWDLLLKLFTETSLPTSKLFILKALGCSDSTEKLKQLLDLGRNASVVRPQDLASAYAAVYNNPAGVDLVLDDLSKNAEQLIHQFSGLQKILNGLGNKITTQDQLSKLVELGKIPAVKAIPAYDAAVSTATVQVAWVGQNKDAISNWLDNYNSAAAASASALLLALTALFAFLNH